MKYEPTLAEIEHIRDKARSIALQIEARRQCTEAAVPELGGPYPGQDVDAYYQQLEDDCLKFDIEDLFEALHNPEGCDRRF